jgi:xanthine dehydrogenase accessory factor
VMDELRTDGVAEDLLDALDTPAGLDIGARTAAEVALSIVARIVELRRTRPQLAAAEAPRTAIDPICGMTVVVGADTPSLEHDGGTVYFCGAGCRQAFEERREPARNDG